MGRREKKQLRNIGVIKAKQGTGIRIHYLGLYQWCPTFLLHGPDGQCQVPPWAGSGQWAQSSCRGLYNLTLICLPRVGPEWGGVAPIWMHVAGGSSLVQMHVAGTGQGKVAPIHTWERSSPDLIWMRGSLGLGRWEEAVYFHCGCIGRRGKGEGVRVVQGSPDSNTGRGWEAPWS